MLQHVIETQNQSNTPKQRKTKHTGSVCFDIIFSTIGLTLISGHYFMFIEKIRRIHFVYVGGFCAQLM